MKDGKSFFDMTDGVTTTLHTIGITDVQDCGINTYADEEYFSYRLWSHQEEEKRPENYSTFANVIFLK